MKTTTAYIDGIGGESMRTGSYFDFDGMRPGSNRYTEVEWTLFPGTAQMVRQVRELHPKGVHGVLIGVRKVPAFHLTVTSNGIIAVLIGLLLPAVQKAREAASADRRLLDGMLAPGGLVAFAMADGSVKFPNVFVTSYQSSGSAGGDIVPMLTRILKQL